MVIGSDAIEGYDIQEQIGRGGFATVYRAADLAHGRLVAIKVINGILNADERRRFDRERMAIGQVADHPNVVAVYESGVTGEGQAYMVLEFATGGSLGNRLETQGPVPWHEAATVMGAVADAVSAAHAVQIRHRDIKPDNILLSQYGVPKLSDFGIASVASGVTTASAATMTVSHSPPEMLQGLDITDAADVYSMASTFHHLVTGQPPFAREGDANVAALITRVLTGSSPSLTAHGVPQPVADVITRALVKDPAARTASAAAFRAELLEAAGKPVLARGSAVVEPPSGATIAVDRQSLGLDVTPHPLHISGEILPPANAGSTEAIGSILPLDGQSTAPALQPPTPLTPAPAAPPAVSSQPVVAGSKSLAPMLAALAVAAVVGVGALWAFVLRDGSEAAAPTDSSLEAATGATTEQPAAGATGTARADGATIGDSEPSFDLLTVGTGPQRPVQFGREIWVSNFDSGTITVVDVATRREVVEISVGTGPSVPVVANGSAWVALSGEDALVEIDLSTHNVIGTVGVGDEPGVPALVGSQLWVPNQAGSTLSRVDPATRAVVGTLTVEQRPLTPAASRDTFWVSSGWSTVVSGFTVDGADNGFFLTGELPLQPLVVGERVFVSNSRSGSMTIFDIESGETSSIDFGADSAPLEPVFDGDEIWVPLSGASALARVDPVSGMLTGTVTVDSGPLRPVFDGAALWVPASTANTMQLVDADSAEVLQTVTLPFAPGLPVLVDSAVWVASQFSDQVAIIDYSPQASMADFGTGDDEPDAASTPTTTTAATTTGTYDREANVQQLIDESGVDRATAECIVDRLEVEVGPEAMAAETLSPEQEILMQSIVFSCAIDLLGE